MRKIIALASAGVLLAVTGLTAAAPAQAAPWWWYNRPHYHNYWGPGPALGAGILGFAAGAAIAGAARDRAYYASGDDHVAACEDTYRSYDYRTYNNLGYDGMRHYCEL